MEPPHSYVRDASASVVHHEDYLDRRDDRALCGTAFEHPVRMSQIADSIALCPDCEAKLVEYHLRWWRDKALAAMAENDELRSRYHEPAGKPDDQRSREPVAASSAERVDTKPASLLDHARRELLELCRQFEGSVPFRRVKLAMQSFSDKLNSDERALLAQQIGNDGSLLRWSTLEVQRQGWHLTGNPMQEEAEPMWDAWTQDSHHTPKHRKWRLGRPRSHESG